MNRLSATAVVLLLLFLSACRKDGVITSGNAQLDISVDTLHFDTVFTSTGSVTRSFKIFNRNNRKLRISRLALGGGSKSYFRINADGFPGPDVQNIDINANDSAYVFVTVLIDPSAADLPFVVQDSIQIEYNGQRALIQLDAWGQNAVFLRSAVINGNVTWTHDLPYVILGGLRVDRNAKLTVPPGTRVFLHADAPILVDGTLIAAGTRADSIVFTGDRLDDPYNRFPGSWPGIVFRDSSHDNSLTHVIVRNALQGIKVQGPSLNDVPKLALDKCIVDNCFDAGLTGMNTFIQAQSSLISNCGKNVVFTKTGRYELSQCTIAAYSNQLISHKDPVLTIANDNGINDSISAVFTNCIFWGDEGVVDNEVDVQRQGNASFSVDFVNCLWRQAVPPSGVTMSGIIANQDPMFTTVDNRLGIYDFHLSPTSPAIAAGFPAGIASDLDDRPRDVNFPDLGAYQAGF